MNAAASRTYRFIDIGANLTDPIFHGIYRGTRRHEDDFASVLQRSWDIGMQKIIITGGSVKDSKEAIQVAKQDVRLRATVGCHPTRCSQFEKMDPEKYLLELKKLILDNPEQVVAYGEFGLDYDRLQFCPKEVQKKYFERQFEIVEQTNLPLFLHCRNASVDFTEIIRRNRDKFSTGVVHSYTGSKEEALEYLDMGLYIGINGCSLKTQENIEVMKSIPVDRLMIETDAPWCEVKSTHAGFKHVRTQFVKKAKERWLEGAAVKGRSEPAFVVQVLEVMSAARGQQTAELADAIYENTCKVFKFA